MKVALLCLLAAGVALACDSGCNTGEDYYDFKHVPGGPASDSDFPSNHSIFNFFLGDICTPQYILDNASAPNADFKKGNKVTLSMQCVVKDAARLTSVFSPGHKFAITPCRLYNCGTGVPADVPGGVVVIGASVTIKGHVTGFIDGTVVLDRVTIHLRTRDGPAMKNGDKFQITYILDAENKSAARRWIAAFTVTIGLVFALIVVFWCVVRRLRRRQIVPAANFVIVNPSNTYPAAVVQHYPAAADTYGYVAIQK